MTKKDKVPKSKSPDKPKTFKKVVQGKKLSRMIMWENPYSNYKLGKYLMLVTGISMIQDNTMIKAR